MIARLLLLALPFAVLRAEEIPIEEIPIEEINDAVAFLAGIDLPHEAEHPLAGTSSWQSHKAALDKEFEGHRERVLSPMTEWSQAELTPEFTSGSVVRYLFSGPDILHAYHMFPPAGTFIMCGLEPVGEIPTMSGITAANSGRALGEVRNALGEIVNFSFFRTADMKEDLQFAEFRGTTPIIAIFLARSGQYLKGIEFFQLEEDGTLKSQGMEAKGADAVKIVFSPRRLSNDKTLYYFSSDLSDGGFPKSGFQTWLEAQPKGNSYLKAASFLMHESYFGKVRDHLLEYSVQIVQDDSGIPFRYFAADAWYADLFGTYSGPIDLFAQHYQGGLRAAYRDRAKPLEFGTGYKWRKGESNLMRFVKQDAVAELTAKEEKPEEEAPAVEKPMPTEAAAPTEPEKDNEKEKEKEAESTPDA